MLRKKVDMYFPDQKSNASVLPWNEHCMAPVLNISHEPVLKYLQKRVFCPFDFEYH